MRLKFSDNTSRRVARTTRNE